MTSSILGLHTQRQITRLNRMMRLRALSVLCLLSGGAVQLHGYQSEGGPSYGPITVETKYGKVIFQDVALWSRSNVTKGLLPWFSAHIENLTGTTWHVAEFTASFQCGTDSVVYKITVPTIVPGEQRFRETSPQVTAAPSCDPSMILIRMIGGRNDREVEERKETERQAREQAAREESEIEQKT